MVGGSSATYSVFYGFETAYILTFQSQAEINGLFKRYESLVAVGNNRDLHYLYALSSSSHTVCALSRYLVFIDLIDIEKLSAVNPVNLQFQHNISMCTKKGCSVVCLFLNFSSSFFSVLFPLCKVFYISH